MPESLTGPDGAALDVAEGERAFAEAMAAPPAPAGGPPAGPPRRDPDAPYGRRKDGAPRGKPGARPRDDRPRVMASAPSGAAGDGKDRSEQLGGLLQIISIPLVAVPALRPDAGALAMHGPGLVAGANEIAKVNPLWAARIDRLTAIGPYGAFALPAIGLIAQVIRNHTGMQLPNTEDPAALAEQVEQSLAEAQAAEQRQADASAAEAAEWRRLAEADEAAEAEPGHPYPRPT